MERVLAGFPDGRANEGAQAGPPTLVGLQLAQQRGDTAPAYPDGSIPGAENRNHEQNGADAQ
jgi:NADH-quinone oxidoreductase subunit E